MTDKSLGERAQSAVPATVTLSGNEANGGIASLPGFDNSLRLLMQRERYSTTDIAMMFSVSRQRIEQLAERSGIRHADSQYQRGMNCRRMWDDEANRFRPVPSRVLRIAQSSRRRIEREAREAERRRHRRSRVIEAVAALRATLGRDPHWDEIAETLGLPLGPTSARNTMAVLQYWGGPRNTASLTREVRAATGLRPLPRGHQSHRVNRALASLPDKPHHTESPR